MRILYIIMFYLFTIFHLFAGVSDWVREENKARMLLNQGKVEDAIVLFREIILSSDNERLKRESYYWIAIAYINTGKHDLAENNLEFYIRTYGKIGDHYADAFYQRGVNFFLMEKYTDSIDILDGFIRVNPSNKFVPNAYYWIGEALYALGRFDDAQVSFRVVTDKYPQTLKHEASVFKLRLIEHKKTELVLQNIIKWSHEQFLSTINQYKLNEIELKRVIEQLKNSGGNSGATDIEQLKLRISELENALRRGAGDMTMADAGLAEKVKQLELKAKLLERKEQALKLLEEQLRSKEAGNE